MRTSILMAFFWVFSSSFFSLVNSCKLDIQDSQSISVNSYKACNATKSEFCFGFGSTRSCVPKYLSRLTCDPLAAHHPEVLDSTCLAEKYLAPVMYTTKRLM